MDPFEAFEEPYIPVIVIGHIPRFSRTEHVCLHARYACSANNEIVTGIPITKNPESGLFAFRLTVAPSIPFYVRLQRWAPVRVSGLRQQQQQLGAESGAEAGDANVESITVVERCDRRLMACSPWCVIFVEWDELTQKYIQSNVSEARHLFAGRYPKEKFPPSTNFCVRSSFNGWRVNPKIPDACHFPENSGLFWTWIDVSSRDRNEFKMVATIEDDNLNCTIVVWEPLPFINKVLGLPVREAIFIVFSEWGIYDEKYTAIGLNRAVVCDSNEAVEPAELLRCQESNPVSMWQKFLESRTDGLRGDPVKSASETSLLTVENENEVLSCTYCSQEDLGRELEKYSDQRGVSGMTAGHVPGPRSLLSKEKWSPGEMAARAKDTTEEIVELTGQDTSAFKATRGSPSLCESDFNAEQPTPYDWQTSWHGNFHSRQEQGLNPDTLARLCEDLSESAKMNTSKGGYEGDYDSEPADFSYSNIGKGSQVPDAGWSDGGEFPQERSGGHDPVTLKTFDLPDESRKPASCTMPSTKTGHCVSCGENGQQGRVEIYDRSATFYPIPEDPDLEVPPSDSDEEWLVSKHAIDSSVTEIMKETESPSSLNAELNPHLTDLLTKSIISGQPGRYCHPTRTANFECKAQGDVGEAEHTLQDLDVNPLIENTLGSEMRIDSLLSKLSDKLEHYLVHEIMDCSIPRVIGHDLSPLWDATNGTSERMFDFEMDLFSVFPAADVNDELPEVDAAGVDEVSSPVDPCDIVDSPFYSTVADVSNEVKKRLNSADDIDDQELGWFERKKPETDSVLSPVDDEECLISWNALGNATDDGVTSDAVGSPVVDNLDDDGSPMTPDVFGESFKDTGLVSLDASEDPTGQAVNEASLTTTADECLSFPTPDRRNAVASEEENIKDKFLDAGSTGDACFSNLCTLDDLFEISLSDTSLITLDHCSSYESADGQNFVSPGETQSRDSFADSFAMSYTTSPDASGNPAGRSCHDTRLTTLEDCTSCRVTGDDAKDIATSAESNGRHVAVHINLNLDSGLETTGNGPGDIFELDAAGNLHCINRESAVGTLLLQGNYDVDANENHRTGGIISTANAIGQRTPDENNFSTASDTQNVKPSADIRGNSSTAQSLDNTFPAADGTHENQSHLPGNDVNLIALNDVAFPCPSNDIKNMVASIETTNDKTADSAPYESPGTKGDSDSGTVNSSQMARDECSSYAVADAGDSAEFKSSNVCVMEIYPNEERHYKLLRYFENETRRTPDRSGIPGTARRYLNDLIPYVETEVVATTDYPMLDDEMLDENANAFSETLQCLDPPEVRGVSLNYLDYCHSMSIYPHAVTERDESDSSCDEIYTQELPVIPEEEDVPSDVSEECGYMSEIEYTTTYPGCKQSHVAEGTPTRLLSEDEDPATGNPCELRSPSDVECDQCSSGDESDSVCSESAEEDNLNRILTETDSLRDETRGIRDENDTREDGQDEIYSVSANETKSENDLEVFCPLLSDCSDFLSQKYVTQCDCPYPSPARTFYPASGEYCLLSESETTDSDQDDTCTTNRCDLVADHGGDDPAGTPVEGLPNNYCKNCMDIDYFGEEMDPISGSVEDQNFPPTGSDYFEEERFFTGQNLWLSSIEEESEEGEEKRLTPDRKQSDESVDETVTVVEESTSSAVFRPPLTFGLPNMNWDGASESGPTACVGIDNEDIASFVSQQRQSDVPDDLDFDLGILETENPESSEFSDDDCIYPGEKVFRVPKCVLKGIINYEDDYDCAATLCNSDEADQNFPAGETILSEGNYKGLSANNTDISEDQSCSVVRNSCVGQTLERTQGSHEKPPTADGEAGGDAACASKDTVNHKRIPSVLSPICDSESAEQRIIPAGRRHSPCSSIDRVLPTDRPVPSDLGSGPMYESPNPTASCSAEADGLLLPGPESIVDPCLEAWFCSETSRNGKPNSFMIESEAQTDEESTGLLAYVPEGPAVRPRIAERNVCEFVEQVTRYGTAGFTAVHCPDGCSSPIKSSGSYSGPEADRSESSINDGGLGSYSLIDSDSGERCLPQTGPSFAPSNIGCEATNGELKDNPKLGSTFDRKTEARQQSSSSETDVVETTPSNSGEHLIVSAGLGRRRKDFICQTGSDRVPFEDDRFLDFEEEMYADDQSRLKEIIARDPNLRCVLQDMTSSFSFHESMDYVLEDDSFEEGSKEDEELTENENPTDGELEVADELEEGQVSGERTTGAEEGIEKESINQEESKESSKIENQDELKETRKVEKEMMKEKHSNSSEAIEKENNDEEELKENEELQKKKPGSHSGPKADLRESSINDGGFGNYSLIDSDSGEKCPAQTGSSFAQSNIGCDIPNEFRSRELQDTQTLGSTGADDRTTDTRQQSNAPEKDVVETALSDRGEHLKVNAGIGGKKGFTCETGSDQIPFEDDWFLDFEDEVDVRHQSRLKEIISRDPKFRCVLQGMTSSFSVHESMDYVLEDDSFEEGSMKNEELTEKENTTEEEVIIARDPKFRCVLQGMTPSFSVHESMDYVLEDDAFEEGSKEGEELTEKKNKAEEELKESDEVENGKISGERTTETEEGIEKEMISHEESKEAIAAEQKKINQEGSNGTRKAEKELIKEKDSNGSKEIEKEKNIEEASTENEGLQKNKPSEGESDRAQDNETMEMLFKGQFHSMDRPPSPFADDWFSDCRPDRFSDQLARGSKEYEDFIRETAAAFEKYHQRALSGDCMLVRQVKQGRPQSAEAGERELVSDNVFLPGDIPPNFQRGLRTDYSSVESVYFTPVFNQSFDDLPLQPCPNDDLDFLNADELGYSMVTANRSNDVTETFYSPFYTPRTPVLAGGTSSNQVRLSVKSATEADNQNTSVDDVVLPVNQDCSASHDLPDIPDFSFHSINWDLSGTSLVPEQDSKVDSGGGDLQYGQSSPKTETHNMAAVADSLVQKDVDCAQHKILKVTNSLPLNLTVVDHSEGDEGEIRINPPRSPSALLPEFNQQNVDEGSG